MEKIEQTFTQCIKHMQSTRSSTKVEKDTKVEVEKPTKGVYEEEKETSTKDEVEDDIND